MRTKGDLGSYPQLYGRPQVYARLLSNELAYVYKGPLLVVMPQGFATRHVPAATAGLLHGLAIDASSPNAMTEDSIAASRRLLTADGVEPGRRRAGRDGSPRAAAGAPGCGPG